MTHEEDELRRALEARSGAPSTAFRTRLGQALAVRPAAPSFMPALSAATVVVLTLASVGILVGAGHMGRKATGASGVRAVSPNPSPAPVGGFAFQLSAPSAGVVWALYDPDKLYRSTDGGVSWQVESTPAYWGVHPVISFIDDHEGWWLAPGSPTTQCEAADAAIWHTTDAGADWQELSAKGMASTQCKNGIWFFDAKHGLVSAWDQNHRPTVYRTTDGGNTWVGTTIQDPAYFKSSPGGFTLQVDWIKRFGATAYLEVHGTQDDPNLPHDNQFILSSADGGASWTLVTKVASRSVVMVTPSRWIDLSAPGQSMESVNGGQQFHPFASDFNAYGAGSTRFVFADDSTGFAVGNNGLFQRTLDGGAHWTRLAPPGLGNVNATPTPTPSQSPGSIPMPTDARISAPSPNVVWALVANDYLFRSTDQGTTWQPIPLPASGYFSDLSFVDDQAGWVSLSGPGGTQCSFGPAAIWRTADAGTHWSMVVDVGDPTTSGSRVAGSIAGEQCKENISFIDREHGFLDAWDPNSPPTIYRTSDGGLTWSASRLTDPPGFHTLGAGDSLRAGLVRTYGATLFVTAGGMQPDGVHAYVFESTDGGVNWTYETNVPSTANAFVFTTAKRWLILGNDGSGQETVDGGTTWHDFTTDYHDAAGVASTFVFVDGSTGYGTVRGGVQRTTDGGSHWTLIKTSWP